MNTMAEAANDTTIPQPPFLFTVEMVRALVNEHVLHGNRGQRNKLREPSPKALDYLADRLNDLKTSYRPANGPLRHREGALDRLTKALDEIDALLPEVMTEFERQLALAESQDPSTENDIGFSYKEIKKMLVKQYKWVVNLHDAIVGPVFVQYDGLSRRDRSFIYNPWSNIRIETLPWRAIAPMILYDLQQAVLSTNPNARIGLSNDGPGPRFVAAVIKIMHGETPTVPNVAKALKDFGRKVSHTGQAERMVGAGDKVKG
jgi:hypothetical protein